MSAVSAQEVDPGVTVRLYQLDDTLDRLEAIQIGQTPNVDFLWPRLDLNHDDFAHGEKNDIQAPFVTEVTAQLLVETAGDYVFALTSDDGSRLTIGGQVLIDHDGRHGMTTAQSVPYALAAGSVPLRIDHFDSGGHRGLRLQWRLDDDTEFQPIPARLLKTERDLTRVTSPGPKMLKNARRPGDGKPLKGVHPAWRVEAIRPDGFKPKVGALAILPDGRLCVGTFDPLQRDDRSLPDIDSKRSDRLYAISNWDDGDPTTSQVVEIASGIYEPSGLAVVGDDLFVAQRKRISRLSDRDGDGFYETQTTVAEGWEGWNYHQFAFQLLHRDGKLYTALSTAMAPPAWEGMETNAGPNGPMRGSVLEIDLDSGEVHVMAGGTRTPNGLGWGPEGSLLYADNQGTWMPVNQLGEVRPGTFFGHYNWTRPVTRLLERFPKGGHPSAYSQRLRTPAAILMPQSEAANSPTEIQRIPNGPFQDQLLVGELTAGGLRRIFLERVAGRLQGATFRFTQGLECGVNRLIPGPDGSWVVGGIGAGGNWHWKGTQFGLQRLVPSGESAFEFHSIEALPSGFRITFTEPVDAEWLSDPKNYAIQQYTYQPTSAYGGPKKSVETLPVTSIVIRSNRSVEIALAGLKASRCVHFRIDAISTRGAAMWSPEAWYTLNAIPLQKPTGAVSIGSRRVPATEVGVGARASGDAVPLIHGHTSSLMSYRGKEPSKDAVHQDELIGSRGYMEVGQGSGDLISRTQFADARIHVEWYSPPGGSGQRAGNSGVYLQDHYEIQVLGTPAPTAESPGAPAANEAGAIYAIKAADQNASTGPGSWQAYDIWFRAARYQDNAEVEPARVTVLWNGRLVHDNVELPHGTGARRARSLRVQAAQAGLGDHGGSGVALGPLLFQDHGSDAEGAVRYRNVWMAPLTPDRWNAGEWEQPLAQPSDWVVRGGRASFRWDDSTLVGTSVPNSPNSFLTSRELFDDFELVYSVRVDPRLNSGVQIRSEVVGGFEKRSGGLRGYQVEIDPSDRAYSGGLYEERARGWLHPLAANPAARRAFRNNDWNRFRVVARGPVVETWINGVPAGAIFDAERRSGRLGFQVHGVGDETLPMTVEFRDVQLRRLSKD